MIGTKKSCPSTVLLGQDLVFLILRCHPAWYVSDVPTQCIRSYAGLFLQRTNSVSHTPEISVSARPQKSIQSDVQHCHLTIGSSLEVQGKDLLTLLQRFNTS